MQFGSLLTQGNPAAYAGMSVWRLQLYGLFVAMLGIWIWELFGGGLKSANLEIDPQSILVGFLPILILLAVLIVRDWRAQDDGRGRRRS